MERYVVTGATGFLGNVVVRKLCEQNKNVIAILLPNENTDIIKDLPITICFGDVRDKEFISSTISKNDIVIHLAGIVDIAAKKNDVIYDVNVNGTKTIADVCLEKKVKKFIYISSVHIIVPQKDNEVMIEPNTFNEELVLGDYAKTKTIATKYVLSKVIDGLNAVVCYPSGIIGPYDNKISNTGQVIIDYLNGKLYAYVKGGYNFVDVRDVANGIISAITKGTVGEGYILSGHKVSIKEVIEILNKKTGRKKMPPKIALWFVKLFSGLAELYYKIRKQKPIFSAYSLDTLNTNCNFDNSKAVANLNFNSRPAAETLNDTVDWFLENKPELLKNRKK